MIKYVTGYSKDEIEECEVVRETEKCVFIDIGLSGGERRHDKVSSYCQYHDTWEDAYKYLISSANRRVDFAETQFKRECDKRLKIESLREDKL